MTTETRERHYETQDEKSLGTEMKEMTDQV